MNMKEIEALITVMKCKSFSEAAFIINYSPSVISKHISKLENELGVIMFIRSNRASSINLTEEGEALMPDIIRMYDYYLKIQNDAAALRSRTGGRLRIGTGINRCTPGRDEILASFICEHPDIPIEQIKLNFDSQIHSLYSGDLDGAFLLVQKDSYTSEKLEVILNDPKIESHRLVRSYDMYMAISEKDPLAANDAAPFSAFRNFAIAFHPNQEILAKGGTMTPFVLLSKKYGFDLKCISLDPCDSSAFYLATQTKIAIPSVCNTSDYPGVKFVRVSDWDTYSTSYFLMLKSKKSRSMTLFCEYIHAFLKR